MKGRFAVGIAVSAVLLVLLFLKVDVREVGRAFAQAAPLGLAVTVLIHLLVLSLKAVRWHVVLSSVAHPDGTPHGKRPDDPAARWLVFDSLFLGYFGNYVLPAKLGEVGRSLLYARRSAVPFPTVVATIVFERFLDALTLIAGFYVILLLFPLPDALPDWLHGSVRGIAVASLVGLFVLYGLWRRLPKDASELGQGAGSKLLTAVLGAAATFRRGLAVMDRPGIAAQAVGWTVAIWSIEAVSVWICLRAFGVYVPGTAAALQMIVASFAIAAPSAPGGLGIHQVVTVAVLAPYGVGDAEATAASLVLTFAVIFWVVPLGLHGMWRQGSSTAQLQRELDATAGA